MTFLSEEQRIEFEETAGVLEYYCGLSRAEAETLAAQKIRKEKEGYDAKRLG